MKMGALTCAAMVGSFPLSAGELGLVIDLLPGHPIYHESEAEAGVVMAIAITSDRGSAADLRGLCEELRLAAGLAPQKSQDLPLEVVFIVPYKDMAIEGYYLPVDGADATEALVRGNDIPRKRLDGIVGRAGIPAHVLDEVDVEHEISCELAEPAWLIRWEDVRPVDGEGPDEVIESARQRFMTLHRTVIEHAMGAPSPAALQPPGSPRLARSSVE